MTESGIGLFPGLYPCVWVFNGFGVCPGRADWCDQLEVTQLNQREHLSWSNSEPVPVSMRPCNLFSAAILLLCNMIHDTTLSISADNGTLQHQAFSVNACIQQNSSKSTYLGSCYLEIVNSCSLSWRETSSEVAGIVSSINFLTSYQSCVKTLPSFHLRFFCIIINIYSITLYYCIIYYVDMYRPYIK